MLTSSTAQCLSIRDTQPTSLILASHVTMHIGAILYVIITLSVLLHQTCYKVGHIGVVGRMSKPVLVP